MKLETYLTTEGIECVSWTDESGIHSMFKDAYDKMQQEQSTEIPTSDEA